jgi:glycosyltransferase involved in cell wall biosynthesis
MKPLRVLWLSPWMRPLARVYAEALRRKGVQVQLITSDQHPEADGLRDYELVLDPRFRTASTWPSSFAAWRRVRDWRPDVVVTELVRDPRWIAFAANTPRVQLVHDDRAHDPHERPPRYERAVFDRWAAGAEATVVFSDYVASAVAGRADVVGTRLHTVPLTSDLDPVLVPAPAPAAARHDFVLIGRLNPYKNLDVVLDAWAAHVDGACWRGDDLVLLGDGPCITRRLPKHTSWRRGAYRYHDVVSTVAAAKGSIAHYRRASQSGVQVLSMQLGVTPIVSPVGALPEFAPPGREPVGVDDVEGLAAAFDELADPETAARHGAAAAQHYAQRFAADHAAERLLNVLTLVGGRSR